MLRLIYAPGFFRLMLAVAVIVSHLTRIDIGRLGVLLFFYLSGYWVSRIWAGEFEGRATLRFYQSRILRIMPLFWIAFALGAGLRQEHISFASLLLMGVATTKSDPTGVAWSLDIELQFYLMAPLLLTFLLRDDRRRAALVACAAALVTAALAWRFLPLHGVVTVAQYLPAFLLGAITFTTAWKPGPRAAALSAAAFAALTLTIGMHPWTSSFLDKTVPDPFENDIFGFFWMLPLLPFVAWSLTNRSTAMDRRLGDLSYPLYLVHFPIIAALAPIGGLAKLEALLASLVVALIIYVAADRPIDGLRRRILAREGIFNRFRPSDNTA